MGEASRPLELSGKRVCILGCGDVGREIAKRLKAFGCHITGVNRTVRVLLDFDELLPLDKLPDAAAACDILVCCIALTPETRGIVSEEIFGRRMMARSSSMSPAAHWQTKLR